jgi:hypothetical protein
MTRTRFFQHVAVYCLSVASLVVNPREVVAQSLTEVESAVKAQDHMGTRILAQRILDQKKLNATEAHTFKLLLHTNAPLIGFDLLKDWTRSFGKHRSNLDTQLEAADQILLSGRFEEAFTAFQKVARWMKSTMESKSIAAARREELVQLYPYVLHSMGRALYGARRYRAALIVYSWIEPSYPLYQEILFERMWTAFRTGRVDIALGSIASQHSAYFGSGFLPSESYLIQTYLYRNLCRFEQLGEVRKELELYQNMLNGKDVATWARSHTDTRVFATLLAAPDEVKGSSITTDARKSEKTKLRVALERMFEKSQKKSFSESERALAYIAVSEGRDRTGVLKRLNTLPTTDASAKLNLEVWAADSMEEWRDEVGAHRFFGKSYCKE